MRKKIVLLQIDLDSKHQVINIVKYTFKCTFMNYITTTQLRTDSPKLIASLKSGEEISLIHRSQVIGVIKPKSSVPAPIKSMKLFKTYLQQIKPKIKFTSVKRTAVYTKHLLTKYG